MTDQITKHEVGVGWLPHVIEAEMRLLDLNLDIKKPFAKEKFGMLIFSVGGPDWKHPDVLRIINEVSTKLSHICEYCGAPGKHVYINEWARTRCPSHLNTPTFPRGKDDINE